MKRPVRNLFTIIGGLGLTLILASLFLIFKANLPVSSTPRPTSTTPIETPFATATHQPIIPTSTPGIGSITLGKDGANLVYVPAGKFEMGSVNGYPDEKPVHTVSLNAFWIGQTEITNSMYSSCIDADVCQSLSRPDYYSRDASSPDYPVVFVSWNDANKYCEWAGGRLPTEAEWEFASRGTDDRIYPWGNQFECTKGNFDDEISEDPDFVSGGPNCDGYQYLAPVGKFPNGISPFGLLDMSGNVWEWVSDWYGEYKDLAVTNPTGPTSGARRVVRGGAWLNDKDMLLRTSNRHNYPPDLVDDNVGFRCVLPED